ncbi:C13 family peptidase [Lichenifustis flavocetrariae]|uniref:C13 family peptidase n=1 Tax=Lichenifustis flavocetrariae TaxID=2949735 RepID=A0AA42CLC0_9HYPH|nr:C13 family peptidase [Lichenifustis flavocetrariae]MCW6507145.1 C13 family peptidase [Lichenifustis flavocetrariae]
MSLSSLAPVLRPGSGQVSDAQVVTRKVWRISRDLRAGLAAAFMVLVACLTQPIPASAEAATRGAIVSLALWSDGSVFRSEAKGAAQIVSRRYGHGGPVIVRVNTGKSFAAGPRGMVQALAAAERGMDPARDVLFLILSSHGAPEGIAEKGGRVEGLLSPRSLGEVLAQSAFKHKVLIVSACFAGIFTPLANDDTLVITAADATHPSFGCEEGRTWTYFGDAFFNDALRKAGPLPERFEAAKALIRAREEAQGFDPSNPQIAGGSNVLPLIDGP